MNQSYRSFFFVFLLALVSGCGTTQQRIATEQMLLSDAVDQAVGQINFNNLAGRKVYLDSSYLVGVKSGGIVDSNYIVSAIRQQLTAANCSVQTERDDADVIVEPRVGTLGSDSHDITYGLPATSALSTAAAAVAEAPLVPSIPELSLGRTNSHRGVAKLIVFAYDRDTREPLWQSGVAKYESTSRNTWVLGIGPFQRGTIHDGVQFAGTSVDRQSQPSAPKPDIPFQREFVFQQSIPWESVTPPSPAAPPAEHAEQISEENTGPNDQSEIVQASHEAEDQNE